MLYLWMLRSQLTGEQLLNKIHVPEKNQFVVKNVCNMRKYRFQELRTPLVTPN